MNYYKQIKSKIKMENNGIIKTSKLKKILIICFIKSIKYK